MENAQISLIEEFLYNRRLKILKRKSDFLSIQREIFETERKEYFLLFSTSWFNNIKKDD